MSEPFKRKAAEAALALVRPGMRLGLGTGSTARHFVDLLGERVAGGLAGITCVPTSEATARQARDLRLALTSLDEIDSLDLTVDGADEFDSDLNLIKGGGGALLREKIVAAASAMMVVIADASKQVERLGRFPLPVEIVPFGVLAIEAAMRRVFAENGFDKARMDLRRLSSGAPSHTDNGNLILDCRLGAIEEPARLAAALAVIPGVVEHGLFIDLCARVYVGGPDGVAVLDRKS